MKTRSGVWLAAAGLAVISSGWVVWAQLQPGGVPLAGGAQSVSSVVAGARAQAAREPVSPKTIPLFTFEPSSPDGTYWMLQSDTPPLPFDPFPELTVFGLGGEGWLVDDRSVDYPGLRAQLWAEAQARLALRNAEGGGVMTMNSGVPAPPDDGGDGGTNDPPYTNPPPAWIYGTNELWLELQPPMAGAASFVIHTPDPNAVYDLYSTTNLSPVVTGLNLTNWVWLARSLPGQTNFTLVDFSPPQAFFRLGGTNDSDGGGFSDPYERWVSHGSLTNGADDVFPVVSIVASDSVAYENIPTANTARFRVRRSGGGTNYALAVGLAVSGTATQGVDYALATLTTNPYPMGRAIILPAGQSSVEIVLTATNDAQLEGTETTTLTVATNWPFYHVDASAGQAMAWIVEADSWVYTFDPDFKLGVLAGLEAVSNQLQFAASLPVQFPFINVACSGRGTMARINTTNGQVMGEYRTAPLGLPFSGEGGVVGPSPSRTTVDQYGNVWVANRNDDLTMNGAMNGSITRIGLILGGTRHVKSNGNYYANPNGQYVSLSNATYNTCVDRDGDTFIRTSTGLADILSWNNDGGADSQGGVSTAEDEAITAYTRVPCTGTRTLAVDKFNDIWVGGHKGNRTHLKVNGLVALPVPGSAFEPTNGGYGGVIDGLGHLWSSGNQEDIGALLWLWPPTNFPPQQYTNWWGLNSTGTWGYGIAVDPLHPYIWQSDNETGNVFRWHLDGTLETDTNGVVVLHQAGHPHAQGLAVDGQGHVWVAHGRDPDITETVGHLNTNGVLVGTVSLVVTGLWAEYFATTNLSGGPVRTNWESPVNFTSTNGWPESPVPPTAFSARWSGILEPQAQGDHVFYVNAEAGAAFRLRVNGITIIDNWANPGTNTVELAGTNWLGTNLACDLRLEYAHWTNTARVRLSWKAPGLAAKEVIPAGRFASQNIGATGVSVDAAGKIWAACYNSSTAVRMDPAAGPLVVVDDGTNQVTNHVGLVDMVVSLGDGSFHTGEYAVPAYPYNYSDMTGANGRVVNPGGQPLKGYWTVIHDSGRTNEFWQRVSWADNLPIPGCGIEVWVRASDDRLVLASERFLAVSNNTAFTGINGRFIEVRVALTREDASKQPVLYELTLHASSTSLSGFLDDAWAEETQEAEFITYMAGPGPLTYEWWVQYPWMEDWDWTSLAGETNSSLVLSNVDSWVGARLNAQNDLRETLAVVRVGNAVGESVWLNRARLFVSPLEMRIPDATYASGPGPAQRYPATIHVFGQPTNVSSVSVILWDLSHQHSADLSILLVSPCGTNVMLISNVGGPYAVSHASIEFLQYWTPPVETNSILPAGAYYVKYGASNYGQVGALPQIGPDPPPSGTYSTHLEDLIGRNPNGTWKLYIYDDSQSGVGSLSGSWSLDITFQ